jgi:hypothetical protein
MFNFSPVLPSWLLPFFRSFLSFLTFLQPNYCYCFDRQVSDMDVNICSFLLSGPPVRFWLLWIVPHNLHKSSTPRRASIWRLQDEKLTKIGGPSRRDVAVTAQLAAVAGGRRSSTTLDPGANSSGCWGSRACRGGTVADGTHPDARLGLFRWEDVPPVSSLYGPHFVETSKFCRQPPILGIGTHFSGLSLVILLARTRTSVYINNFLNSKLAKKINSIY